MKILKKNSFLNVAHRPHGCLACTALQYLVCCTDHAALLLSGVARQNIQGTEKLHKHITSPWQKLPQGGLDI